MTCKLFSYRGKTTRRYHICGLKTRKVFHQEAQVNARQVCDTKVSQPFSQVSAFVTDCSCFTDGEKQLFLIFEGRAQPREEDWNRQ